MTEQEPGNAEVTVAHVARAIEGFFPGDLGIEVIEVSADGAVGRLVCEAGHLHPGGQMHGGVWASFADTVAAWATRRSLSVSHGFTTVEMKLNVFSAAVVGDELIATARPLHRGSRTHAWEVRIEKAGRLAAMFVATQLVLHQA